MGEGKKRERSTEGKRERYIFKGVAQTAMRDRDRERESVVDRRKERKRESGRGR